jgi:hypothetical protein
MLFQISGNAQILNSIITPLSKILGCSSSAIIHTAIMQRPDIYDLAIANVVSEK